MNPFWLHYVSLAYWQILNTASLVIFLHLQGWLQVLLLQGGERLHCASVAACCSVQDSPSLTGPAITHHSVFTSGILVLCDLPQVCSGRKQACESCPVCLQTGEQTCENCNR